MFSYASQSPLSRFLFLLSLLCLWLTLSSVDSVHAYAGAAPARRANSARYQDCIYAAADYYNSYAGGNEAAGTDVCSQDISTNAAFAPAANEPSNVSVFVKVVTAAQGLEDSCFFQVADCLKEKPDTPGQCYPTVVCASDVHARSGLQPASASTRSACLATCNSLVSPPNIYGPPWVKIVQIVGRGVVGAVCVAYCNSVN